MLSEFAAEQWMTRYENLASVNMTETSCDALRLEEIEALEPGLFSELVLDYGPITGSPQLKEEILAMYETGTPANITTTAGCVNASQHVMDELLAPGRQVIVFTPGYQQFAGYARSLNARVTELALDPLTWKPDLDQLEDCAARQGLDLLILNLPNNPTGTILDEEALQRVTDIARRHDAWILCDEVYRGIGRVMPSVSDLYEKGVSCGSLSKSLACPGIRIGWVKGPEALIDALNIRRDYTFIGAGALNDRLAWAVLKHRAQILRRNNAIVSRNLAVLKDWLDGNPFFSCVLPEAGSVALLRLPDGVDDEAFALRMMEEKGLFFVPGRFFGAPGTLRLGLGRPPEQFLKGLTLLAGFASGS